MLTWLYVLGVFLLALGLPVFSYLALIYRELGRMTTGRVHEHLDIFESEIEPRLKLNRRSAGRTFRILGHFWLAFLVLETTRGVVYFVPGTWEAGVEFFVFLTLEVVIAMHFIPDVLLYRTNGRWLVPFLPLVRAGIWLVWPVRVFLEGAESLARIAEPDAAEQSDEKRTEEGIEQLVEAAEEEGIIERDQADLIEQVVEFSDKRVREVMTPRPDIVGIAADATLEEVHTMFVQTQYTRLPVFEKSVDDIFGVVFAQDLLGVADADFLRRKVRELVKPALFIPETKSGSELLREMRQKDQPMAIVIDEHGSVAGIVTIEDLVEEIVGETGANGGQRSPDVIREPDGALVMLGNTPISDVEEMLGVHFGENADETVTTIAGLLSHVTGKVPGPGDKIDVQGFRFEVLEAKKRKVLRLRIRRQPATAVVSE